MSYQFRMISYPKEVAEARDSRSGGRKEFTLTFLDGSGFKVIDHKISLNDMALTVDDKGEGEGLDARGDKYMDADTYRRFARWEIGWSF